MKPATPGPSLESSLPVNELFITDINKNDARQGLSPASSTPRSAFCALRRLALIPLVLGRKLFSERHIVLFLEIFFFGTAALFADDGAATVRPVHVGAIRWDAWLGGPVTRQVERTLGAAKYRDRLPWFAEVVDENTVRFNDGTPETMSREIRYAAGAGLDYWAFVMYPRNDSMSRGLELFLQNEDRDKINFCIILHNELNVGPEDWPDERDRIAKLLDRPNYQKVLDGRPLVYFMRANPERFRDLRQTLGKMGCDPYYVFMGWDPPLNFEREHANGFDAVSAYAESGFVKTFDELAEAAEAKWKRSADAGIRYVPLVTTGWDKQPRKDHPVSWELTQSYHQQPYFPTQGTPQQIAEHLRRAIRFVRSHPDVCEAGAVILFAWNEHDEGGWLSPTWTESGTPDTKRLDALRHVLSDRR